MMRKLFLKIYAKTQRSILFTRLNAIMGLDAMIYLFVASAITLFIFKMGASCMHFYKRQQTYTRIQSAIAMVKMYAKTHGSLPYPALTLNGISYAPYANAEDIINNPLEKFSGFLPYRTLGMTPSNAYDGYGRPLKYYVSVCMCKTVDKDFHPNIEAAISLGKNSLLFAHYGGKFSDIDLLGPKSYLKIDTGDSIIGIIDIINVSKLLPYNGDKNELAVQDLHSYQTYDIPAFAIMVDPLKDDALESETISDKGICDWRSRKWVAM